MEVPVLVVNLSPPRNLDCNMPVEGMVPRCKCCTVINAIGASQGKQGEVKAAGTCAQHSPLLKRGRSSSPEMQLPSIQTSSLDIAYERETPRCDRLQVDGQMSESVNALMLQLHTLRQPG